jgi:hypothetical protein
VKIGKFLNIKKIGKVEFSEKISESWQTQKPNRKMRKMRMTSKTI